MDGRESAGGEKAGGKKASHGRIMSAARARGGDISRSRMHAKHIDHVSPMFRRKEI